MIKEAAKDTVELMNSPLFDLNTQKDLAVRYHYAFITNNNDTPI